jgi:hypothetical protein
LAPGGVRPLVTPINDNIAGDDARFEGLGDGDNNGGLLILDRGDALATAGGTFTPLAVLWRMADTDARIASDFERPGADLDAVNEPRLGNLGVYELFEDFVRRGGCRSLRRLPPPLVNVAAVD